MRVRKQPSMNCRNTPKKPAPHRRHQLDQKHKGDSVPGMCMLDHPMVGPRDTEKMLAVLCGRHNSLEFVGWALNPVLLRELAARKAKLA